MKRKFDLVNWIILIASLFVNFVLISNRIDLNQRYKPMETLIEVKENKVLIQCEDNSRVWMDLPSCK